MHYIHLTSFIITDSVSRYQFGLLSCIVLLNKFLLIIITSYLAHFSNRVFIIAVCRSIVNKNYRNPIMKSSLILMYVYYVFVKFNFFNTKIIHYQRLQILNKCTFHSRYHYFPHYYVIFIYIYVYPFIYLF